MTKQHRFKRHLLAAAMLLVCAGAAQAEETVCIGSIGPESLDNIVVPDGATCSLEGTRANGTLKVSTGASLSAFNVWINGNVQAEGAEHVSVTGNSVVGGSVQIKQGGSAEVTSTNITGDLQFDENRGPIFAGSNLIRGNLQAVKNFGGVRLVRNFINGNLQCKENVPRPTGFGNRAASKEDQCARL
jgi:ABC-type molybdate transport system substrate-binding protein